MGPKDFPPDGGTCSTQYTLPDWMNQNGDRIANQTLLMRAVNASNACTFIPSDTPPTPTLPEAKLPTNPFLINKSVEKALGRVSQGLVTAVKEARGTKYVLRTSSKNAFDRLLQMNELIDGTPIEVIPHPSMNFSKGVVYDVDTIEMKENEIQDNLSNQNVVNVRRITKRNGTDTVNTPLVVLTFNEQCPPAYVYYGLIRLPVRRYYPSPLQCYGCAKFGHSRKNCQENICLNCSTNHEITTENPCTQPIYCRNCEQRNDHGPTDKRCPVYKEEMAIIKFKIDQNITFGEARAELKNRRKSTTYANQLASGRPVCDGDKDRQIKALKEEIAKKNQQIEETRSLKVEIELLKRQISNGTQNRHEEDMEKIKEELRKYREAYKATAKELAIIKAKIAGTTDRSTPAPTKSFSQPQPLNKKPKMNHPKCNNDSHDEEQPVTCKSSPTSGNVNLLVDTNDFTAMSQRNKPGTSTQIPMTTRSRNNSRETNKSKPSCMDIDIDVSISD